MYLFIKKKKNTAKSNKTKKLRISREGQKKSRL